MVSPYNVAPAYSSYGAYGGYGVSKVVSPVSSVVSHGYGSPLVGGYAPAVGMISFVYRFQDIFGLHKKFPFQAMAYLKLFRLYLQSLVMVMQHP